MLKDLKAEEELLQTLEEAHTTQKMTAIHTPARMIEDKRYLLRAIKVPHMLPTDQIMTWK
jgi:hypothetical protein